MQAVQSTIQHNCHIADARFASDYTLCVYLLKMREYFRWEKHLPYGASISNEDIGSWLTSREDFWETLEDESFQPVVIEGQSYDPFDSDAINDALRPDHLLYSAGYGNKSKPLFMLARLADTLDLKGNSVYITTKEYARDLTAPPAMSLGGKIFIRQESLRRMLWERYEEWRWNHLDNAMARALNHYDFEADLDTALDEMTLIETDTLILHEVGEIEAGKRLGTVWEEMLSSFPRSRLELMARAVRDHLADALSTLPALLEKDNPASLHFYFGNLSGMRKQIYPALLQTYKHWVECGNRDSLQQQVEAGRQHWLQVAGELVRLHDGRVKKAWTDMETLIEQKAL
ncbi:hypothetical protein MNBD_GAMMA15-1578 [hydrothermal vent metagenome]|uniref:Uncharacterized protein n=1 Tax=hydrothermal vent metagenome TaxID=652676 RepID=A0A3B0Y732_9ZZZZ